MNLIRFLKSLKSRVLSKSPLSQIPAVSRGNAPLQKSPLSQIPAVSRGNAPLQRFPLYTRRPPTHPNFTLPFRSFKRPSGFELMRVAEGDLILTTDSARQADSDNIEYEGEDKDVKEIKKLNVRGTAGGVLRNHVGLPLFAFHSKFDEAEDDELNCIFMCEARSIKRGVDYVVQKFPCYLANAIKKGLDSGDKTLKERKLISLFDIEDVSAPVHPYVLIIVKTHENRVEHILATLQID